MNREELTVIHKAITETWSIVKDVCLDNELNTDLIDKVDKELGAKVLEPKRIGTKEYILRYQIAAAVLSYLTFTERGHK